MTTLDRLNHIRLSFGLSPKTQEDFFGNGHVILNELDRLAKIETRGFIRITNFGVRPTNYVGARLALHEARLARRMTQPAPDGNYHHWLGDTCQHGGKPCHDKDCDKDCHCT